MPTPPRPIQSDDDANDAVEHGAADQRDDPAMTKIAAMIHRIVATPPPQSLAAIGNRSMCSPFRRSRSAFARRTPVRKRLRHSISFRLVTGRVGREGIRGVDRGSSRGARVSHLSWRNVQRKRGASVGLELRALPRLGCTGGSAAGCPSVDSLARLPVRWSEPWSDSSSSIAQRPSLRRSLHRRSLVWA
jgi:hypothetical protein